MHLSINSSWNKLNSLPDIIKGNINILIVLEPKLYNSFPNGNFFLDGFGTPFFLDRDSNGESIIFFIKNEIAAKVVSKDDKPIESFYVGLNFLKKWLLNCSFNP